MRPSFEARKGAHLRMTDGDVAAELLYNLRSATVSTT